MAARDAVTYQEDLEAWANDKSCGCEDGHYLVLVAHCHPRVGLVVTYRPETGCLTFECARCGKAHGGPVAVASDPRRAN